MVDGSATATDSAPDAKGHLRLWLSMLRITRVVESELRERFRRDFASTLPRFDVLAALYRNRDGLLMTDLSRLLLVSNGNVTGIVQRLVDEGFVIRTKRGGDRRTSLVQLTPRGYATFETMAAAHEKWLAEILGGIQSADVQRLSQMLHVFTVIGSLTVEPCKDGGSETEAFSLARGGQDRDHPA